METLAARDRPAAPPPLRRGAALLVAGALVLLAPLAVLTKLQQPGGAGGGAKTALLFSPKPEALVPLEVEALPDSRKQAAAAAAAGSCKTEHDCGLAGDCSGGKCDCDAAWTGPTCTRLALMPTAEESGMRRASHASWGGSVRPTLATASPW